MIKAQKIAFFVSLVLLLTIMLSIVLFAMPITSAEETTDKYVVFNQHVKNGNFVIGTDGFNLQNLTGILADGVYTVKPTTIPDADWKCYLYFSIDILKDHKYFYFFDCKTNRTSDTVVKFNINGSSIFLESSINQNMSTVSGLSTSIVSGNYQVSIFSNFNYFSTNDTISISNINMIDLTQMFGVGNEPDIDTCRNLFTADYYPYNVNGSVISLDGLTDYNRGVLDTYKSYLINFESTIFNNALTPMYNFGHSDSTLGSMGIDTILFGGDLFLSFGGNVLAGTTINITFDSLLLYENTTFTISLILNNHLYPIKSFTSSQENFTFNFVLPFDATGLVFSSVNTNTNSSISTTSFTGAKLVFKSFSNNLLDDLKYKFGYDNGYNDGNTAGYNKGYNKGLAVGSNKQYSFAGLLDAVVQAPITALLGSYDSSGKRVGGLLNFEFLGVNLSYFFTGVLSVTLVIVLIRFILARK